jgi:hypothetical protein
VFRRDRPALIGQRNDPDRLFARATAHGATVVRELRDEDFGSLSIERRLQEGKTGATGLEPSALRRDPRLGGSMFDAAAVR